MKCCQSIQPYDILEFLNCCSIRFFRSDIIASGKNMTRVDTNRHAFGFVDSIDYLFEVLKFVADRRSLSRARLHYTEDFESLCFFVRNVQALYDSLNAVILACSPVCTGMEVQQLNPQLFASR